MRKSVALLAIIWTLVSACAAISAPDKGGATSAKEVFFSRVDALLKLERLRPEAVAKALGKKLVFFKETEDGLDVFTAAGEVALGVTKVELRLIQGEEKGGLLLLSIAPGLGIGKKDVLRRFGKDMRPSLASPHGLKDQPIFFVYTKGGQELRFGIGKEGLLTEVVIDRFQ